MPSALNAIPGYTAVSMVKSTAKKVMPPPKSSSSGGLPVAEPVPPAPSPPPIKPPIESLLEEDMTMIANAFRLTYTTREALKAYDASTLEDFCLMTEHDFESMLVTETRLGRPICPLQQRKVLVLLRWIHQVSEDAAVERAARVFTKNSTNNNNDNNEPNEEFVDGVDKKNKQKPPFIHRLTDPFGTMKKFHHTTMSSIKTATSFGASNMSASASASATSGTGGSFSASASASGNDKESSFYTSLDDYCKYVIIPEDWQDRFRADLPKLKQTLYRERDAERWSLLGDTFLAVRWIFCGYN